ncbi:MAG: hypothetical protein U0527_15915 [Candidatus Eisenbacteria bacterium]
MNGPEIRVDCTDEAKFRIVQEVAREFAASERVLTLDGARVEFEGPEFDGGWGLVRASNTQPVLVLRFESKSAKGYERIESRFREALARYPEVSWPA